MTTTCDNCSNPPSFTRWTPTKTERLCAEHSPTPTGQVTPPSNFEEYTLAMADGWV